MKLKPATEILLSAAFALTPEENWFGWARQYRPGCYCAYTAISESAGRRSDRDAYAAMYQAISNGSIIHFNDTHTHAEVLAALYKAAELSEAS